VKPGKWTKNFTLIIGEIVNSMHDILSIVNSNFMVHLLKLNKGFSMGFSPKNDFVLKRRLSILRINKYL